MNIEQLRQLIQDLPDDTELLDGDEYEIKQIVYKDEKLILDWKE